MSRPTSLPLSVAAILSMLISALAGCSDMSPFWLHPGPAELQQIRAEYIDPYPEPDIGPAVVGGRPRDFQVPPPENERAQNEHSFSQRYGQSPPAGLFKTTPFSPPTGFNVGVAPFR